jgi:trimethylamine--corrinoid protein Co-methyltransferase
VDDLKAKLSLLSNEELYMIHLAILETMERIGVIVESEKAIDILEKGGAEVSRKEKLVKIPSYLVKDSLNKAPERVVMHGRNSKYDIKLENGRVYYGTGSTTPFYRGLDGKQKQARKEFIAEGVKIADGLPNMDFAEQFCLALDHKGKAQDLHEIEAVLLNTEKPIIGIFYSPETTKDAIEMASLIMGGIDELRKKPLITLYAEPISPLTHDGLAIEKLIEYAKVGLPALYSSCPAAGATSPVTLVGTLVQASVESLTGLVVAQLVRKGAPFIFGMLGTILDQSTGLLTYGSPELSLINASAAQLAQYYRLPFFGTGGCCDSKVIDGQAVGETLQTMLMATLSGTNLVHDCGYLESGMTSSPEMLVICNELAGLCKRLANGMIVNDDTLATDVIRDVKPGGHYLAHPHTMKHLSTEAWFPKLLDRNRRGKWERSGSRDLVDRANAEAKRILKEHEPEPLPKDVLTDIHKIVMRAEKR